MSHDCHSRKRRWPFLLLSVLLILLLLAILPPVLPHLHTEYRPDQSMLNLTPMLERTILSREDYQQLFLQTGLAQPAIDALLSRGETGKKQILATQAAFFHPHVSACFPPMGLIREDYSVDLSGTPVSAFPMAPLEKGDVLLSFSAHTLGWRHGHAGLVVGTHPNVTLEAVRLGEPSAQVDASHWATYTTYLHLRLRNILPQQQGEIANFAREHLDGISYRLFSGLRGSDKAPNPADEITAQCAYLVWYALQHAGYDTDSDGGRLVTVSDLAHSLLFEVVQVYGLDPNLFSPF